MAEYSDSESVSESESSSDEEIECVLKKVPKASVPEVKAKRVYSRKKEVDKEVVIDKLQKARDAKALKAATKKQAEAQEKAELTELKKLKTEGKLKVKKERPAEISIPKREKKERVIVKEIHHHYGKAEDEPKPARVKKTEIVQPPPTPRAAPKPVIPKMTFV